MATKMEVREHRTLNVVGGLVVGIVSLLCLLPFVLVISGSFSSQASIVKYGYGLFPREFSLEAYKLVFTVPERIAIAYRNTILYTAVGTGVGLFLTAMTGYALNRKDFAWRNAFAFFFYFTTLFSGGLVPSYLLMTAMHMKNNPLAIVLPGLLSVFNILIMRNFMNSIPDAITESAKVDGANDMVIFLKLILPLLKPALATIGLFLALGYWNSWYSCMLYISDYRLYTLQYYLYNTLNRAEELRRLIALGVDTGMESPPSETMKFALTCVATGPIILLYPFVQKYFVKGITIGAVKG